MHTNFIITCIITLLSPALQYYLMLPSYWFDYWNIMKFCLFVLIIVIGILNCIFRICEILGACRPLEALLRTKILYLAPIFLWCF